MGLLDRLRPRPGWTHEDPKVRREAVATLQDPAILSDLASADPDERVREEAADALLDICLGDGDEEDALAALAGLSEARHLVAVARSAPHEAVGRAALARLTDARAMGSVARNGEHASVRLEALERLDDPDEIGAIALKSAHKEVALAALDKVASLADGRLSTSLPDMLSNIAHRARSRAAVHRARAILRERRHESTGEPGAAETDRERQIMLCDELETLALAEGTKRLAAQISSLHDAWTDLLPNVDEDLERRFEAAYAAARRHLAANRIELAEVRRRDRERAARHERHIAPRLALIDKVASAAEERAAVLLEDARWEWARLEPFTDDEAQDLQSRFDQACEECAARHAAWETEQEKARSEAERAREREERERRERENAARLTRLCDASEKIARAEKLPLRQAERALRQVRAALEDPGPLPARRDRRSFTDRLKAIQSSLAPRVREMRTSESWRRWANTNVQEKLCAAAEGLAAIADPEAAGRRLADLQARWRTASTAIPEKSQDLWNRFKSAADIVRDRVDGVRSERSRSKEALCEQAESLADSTDWVKTAETLKGLQTAWKSIGTAGRAPDRALWTRFRGACDRFFSRRKEDLARRKQEWRKNLEAKEALIDRAGTLADSCDWQTTAEVMRGLQAEWKSIGPVGRAKSQAIWKRFRGHCDRFFDRYKRRDEIDRERHVAEREAICVELESFSAPDDQEALLGALKEIRGRWQRGPALPRAQAAALETRFNAALGRLIESRPERFRDTEMDPEANRKRMEELCARVEGLLPAGARAADESISPATRLATLWVEAMASNTIGGRVAEEAKWRSAEEELRKVQSAWRRIGYVSEEARRPLAERFDRACRRFAEKRPAPPRAARSSPDPRGGRGRRGRGGGPHRKTARPDRSRR